jgi:helix-turn-helix protein
MRTANQVTDPPTWIGVKDAARELSVSVRSIWKYIEHGKITTSRDFGRVRVLRSSLMPK